MRYSLLMLEFALLPLLTEASQLIVTCLEMEFLDINWTEGSSLLLHAIYNLSNGR
jgi:hypothetical protein